MTDRLVKIDKNGTKYYEDCTCQRCGGAGYSDKWAYTGKRCYECGGSGISTPHIYKVYTPEYRAKLDERARQRNAKRMAQLEANADKTRAEWLERKGFDEAGNTWLVLGDTYPIKDELKSKGAKFDYFLGWHFCQDVEEYDTLQVNISTIATPNLYGYNFDTNYDIEGAKKAEYAKIHGIVASQFVGQIGDKITTPAIYIRTSYYDVDGAYYWQRRSMCIHQFKAGNDVLVWNTSAGLPEGIAQGDAVVITGTVKEHKEYKDIKQTALSRCKIQKGDTL